MARTVDAQALTIGVGTIVAVAALGYGTLVSETLLGVRTTTLATGTFALTFLAIAVLHGAYGRADLAGANALAGIGLLLVTIATTGLQAAAGLCFLAIGGAYVAIVTVRARREGPDAAGETLRR
ncbi:hypothetical protein [Halosolutus gelatinilyticus]|uniref:hypothetical protein n=1 Tax=Halosolutus gelatinilyticus TaxID=2931975 RepID=UPI001FF12E21|nr:hypothetical protein [Halosolutus gelatinilyticus]